MTSAVEKPVIFLLYFFALSVPVPIIVMRLLIITGVWVP